MSELERAAAFEELIRDRCVERVVETRFGPALFNDTLSTIWSLNVLRAEQPGDATAEEIAAEADRVQAELGHRRVILPPGAAVLEERVPPARLEARPLPLHGLPRRGRAGRHGPRGGGRAPAAPTTARRDHPRMAAGRRREDRFGA